MGTGTHHHDTAFSIVKALGIVAVVISHAAILTPLETFTYYFNTAVFFFVAGYFFDDGQTAAPGRFIGRKLRRLYLPYVILGTLFVLLHNRFLEWHLIAYDFSAREAILPYDTPELLRTLGRVFLFLHHEQMQAPFWFLQGLFLGLMLFFCITLATRKLAPTPTVAERLRGGSILFLFTVAILLARHPSGIPGEWIAVRTFAITGIIYLGKLFRIFRARLPLDGRIATLCLVILLAAAAAGCRVNLGGRLFANPVFFVVLVCSGCYMLVTAASRLTAYGNPLTRMLYYTGRHTMAIMLWHIPAFKLVILFQMWVCDYPPRYLACHPVIPTGSPWRWIPYTVVGITLPLGFCLLYDRLIRSVRR